jgi:hypothetical protein
MTKYLPFILDNGDFHTNQKCFIITSNNSGQLSLKYLLSFFNSKISAYWIRDNCPELQGGTRELSKIYFENIPIPQLPPSSQKPFEDLVDIILAKKEQGEDTSQEERKIDEMVYALYGLTTEEIAVVEGKG